MLARIWGLLFLTTAFVACRSQPSADDEPAGDAEPIDEDQDDDEGDAPSDDGPAAGRGGSPGPRADANATGGATGERDASAGPGGTADATGGPDLGAGGEGGAGPYVEDPGTMGDGDVVVGPTYMRDPDLTDRGAPKGKNFQFTMPSSASAIFKGDDPTLNQPRPFSRRIDVYVPAMYQDGTEAPVLVIHDGPGQLVLVRNALDNLTRSADPNRKLPPFIIVAVANGGGDSKGSQRGLEYDTMSDRFARFINDEVLPAVLANTAIKAAYPRLAFTKNPWGRGALGCSSGGAAALTMGWFRPDYFRRLITYSGTFVDQQDDDAPEEKLYPLGAWEYHSGMKLIESSPVKPLRIFLHVSDGDLGANAPESGHRNWVMANQRTAAALKAKGYHYRFVFSRSSSHCDSRVFDLTLADTLVWMWRGYH